MECLIGIVGQDFVLLASDANAARSVIVYKQNYDRFTSLGTHVGMVGSGEEGDRIQFTELISKNVQLYKIRNGYPLSSHAIANYTRNSLANYLRSRTPYTTNLLIGGCTKEEGPSLYYIDYLSAMAKVPFGVHGYASYFLMSILDKEYHENLTREEAMKIFQICLKQLKSRFIVSLPKFCVRFIDDSGISEVIEVDSV